MNMSIYRHIAAPPLNQYVDFFWYYVDLPPDHDREHVLPDGTFELIINLQETARKLFHDAASTGMLSSGVEFPASTPSS